MAKRTNRVAWGLVGVLAAILSVGCGQNRRPDRYLIPEGYVGEVSVQYGVKGAPPLPIEDGFHLIKFPSSGILKTSNGIEYGWGKDEYYYYRGAKRRPLRGTGWGEGGMIWAGHVSSPPQSNDPKFVGVPWTAAWSFFVGTEVQLKLSWFLSSRPSKREMEFYHFGLLCGSEDGSQGVDEFAENLNAPAKGMVGAGKTQVYLARLAGGIPGTEAVKEERTKNEKMALAYKLHNLLVAAEPFPQDEYVRAFKKGYGIAQLKLRIKRHTEGNSVGPWASSHSGTGW